MTEQGVTVRGIRNRRECRKLGPNLLLAATALKPELADQIPVYYSILSRFRIWGKEGGSAITLNSPPVRLPLSAQLLPYLRVCLNPETLLIT